MSTMNNSDFAGKKWLVLGASGQLGQEWCAFLEREKREYRGYSRKQLDITDKKQVQRALKNVRPDVVINTAAYTKVDQAEDEKELAERVNVVAAGELARICADAGSLLIHYSTDYVFPGRMADRRQYPQGYPESFPADPVNWYGQTKWQGEEAIRAVGGPHLILRVSWLCGVQGNNFVKTMLRLGRERDHLKVVKDQLGCPTFAGPAVHNSMALIKQKFEGTFHISSKGETSWYELARTIFALKGIGVELEAISTEDWPTPARRPAWSRLDIRQLADVSGTRILPWKEELEKMLAKLPS